MLKRKLNHHGEQQKTDERIDNKIVNWWCIYASLKRVIIDSDYGLPLVRRQAISRDNAYLLTITKKSCQEITIAWKMSTVIYIGLNVLKWHGSHMAVTMGKFDWGVWYVIIFLYVHFWIRLAAVSKRGKKVRTVAFTAVRSVNKSRDTRNCVLNKPECATCVIFMTRSYYKALLLILCYLI